ncbi:hypothetical protein [Thermococcus sp.]|nr:hypothetical protein [Thermococcus sp.]
MNDDTAKHVGVTWILSLIVMMSGVLAKVKALQDLGIGLGLGGPFLVSGIEDYYKIEGAEYIVTHYSGEDAINEAMKLAKDARNGALESWIAGGFFFMLFAWGGLGISMTLTGLANLTNFIVMILAHKRYSELRKMLMILQLKKGDKAEISIKI